MKRTLLAVTIPALMAAMSTVTVDAHSLYDKEGKQLELIGKVGLKRYLSKDDDNNKDDSFLRLGLKGEMPVDEKAEKDEKLKVFAALELNKALGAAPVAARTAVAGLKSEEIGSLSYGRTVGVMDDVTQFTAVLPAFGAEALGDGGDKFGTSRATGLLQYRTPTVQGVQLALQYLGKSLLIDSKETSKIKDAELKKGNDEGYGVSLTHDTGMGVTLGLAYNNVAKNSHQKEHYQNQHKANMVAVGAKYQVDELYLAATYAQTRNQALFSNKNLTPKAGLVKPADETGIYANKTQGFEVVAQYKLPSGLQPSIGYLQSTAQIKNDTYDTKVRNVQYIDVGANYEFNKQISAYADYKINLLNKEKSKVIGASADNILGVGLTYSF